MDSTLLDQIRHLCRDRAAYEHLKAILVQQERVHQLSWEERYEKLISAQSTEAPNSDIFSNIIAREKALAQLADAIQRSPSLELVLQIAVQVAQKLLQVDRVAIFRCHPDGRGEFVTDAIATGLTSLADMPERQLSLARHMIESTHTEHSAQTIDSIRTSSLSSHIVTLLEQIGISFYAANKIYAGQEVWGTLVAFHGSAYHSWSDSDRTSLSLIAAQIGIAIALTNLRQQSQELTDDLQALQVELDNLQQTVVEIAEREAKSTIASAISSIEQITEPTIAQIIPPIAQDLVEDNSTKSANNDLESNDVVVSQVDQALDEKESELKEPSVNPEETEEITDSQYVPIPQNGLPPLFLAPDSSVPSSEIEDEKLDHNITPDELAIASNQDDISADITPLEPLIEFEKDDDITPFEPLIDFEKVVIPENITPVEPAIKFEKADISYVIMPDNLKVISVNESESEEAETAAVEREEVSVAETDSVLTETPNPESSPELNKIDELETSQLEASEPESNAPETSYLESAETEILDSQLSQSENLEPENLEPEKAESEAIALEAAELQPVETEEIIASQSMELEPETITPQPIQQEDLQKTQQIDVDITLGLERDHDDDEPAIEPQFMETILEIAGNDLKAKDFLLNVIDSYLEDTPRLVQEIDKALAVNDQPRLLQSLNTLRSSSDYIGALTLSYQCRQLESAVKANYVVLIYACLSRVAIEAQRATDALRIARSHYKL